MKLAIKYIFSIINLTDKESNNICVKQFIEKNKYSYLGFTGQSGAIYTTASQTEWQRQRLRNRDRS